METPIYTLLQKKINSRVYPFHMPGHKRNKDFLFKEILEYDITELSDTDNMHNPQTIIKKSLENISSYFGSDESYFLVNGSSSGIIAAILSVVKENDKILIARNSHKSVNNALILSGAVPIYVMPSITENGLQGGIAPIDIKNAIKENPDISAVIITSPTYEGFCSDINSISTIVHSYNKILIVDEAHGSHFAFSDEFPVSALSQGADIVIQSWHKTLPALTQSSVLHVKGKLVDRQKLRQTLSIMQTSSPSYILMTTMEKVFSTLKDNPNLFDEYIKILKYTRSKLESLNNIELIKEDIKNKNNISNIDIGKIVFNINSNINGYELEKILLSKYNIEIEMSGLNHIILMTSVADNNNGFKKLIQAITAINNSLSYKLNNTIIKNIKPITVLSPRKAFYSQSITVNIKESIGKVSAQTIIPYPPGIPLITAGELITKDIINILKNYKNNDITITGVEDLSLKTLKIIKGE